MHAERGQLLFRVNADQQLQRYIWPGAVFILAAGFAYYRLSLGITFFLACAGVCFPILLSREVIFYENGLYFPRDPDGTGASFIAWRQIKRFYWDENALTVVSGEGNPARSVRVPAAKRLQVENLLSAIQDARV